MKKTPKHIFNCLLPPLLASCLGSCVSPPSDPNTVECYLIRKICYRGGHPDRLATRERFGIDGIIAIDQDYNRSR